MTHVMLFLEGTLISAVIMLITWLVYLKTQNASNVDVAWVLSSYVVGSFWLWSSNVPNLDKLFIFVLLSLWAIRLGGFLFYTRARVGKIDQRYQTLSQHWTIKQNVAFLLHYQFQGLLLQLVVLPLFIFSVVSLPICFSFKSFLAVLMIGLGIVGEAIADWQLYDFKQSGDKGVCTVGLWGLSRHPNYFCEWLTWLGFSVIVINPAMWASLFALISPLSLYWIMTKITIGLTEDQILSGSRAQAYREVQKRIPAFFPKLFQ